MDNIVRHCPPSKTKIKGMLRTFFSCVLSPLSPLCPRAVFYCSHRKFLEVLSPITANQTLDTQDSKALHCLSVLASLERPFNLS